jgi:putative DNA methylase
VTQHDPSPSNGKRLIEDALPIAAINVVAQREKIGHAATHPRKLHLWWARRPLAAARAAVYAALVPAEGRGRTPAEEADFFDALCRWGAPESAIRHAREEVLRANSGVPPKVVDLFAGGGAIPLEAARLGCETTAIELNPVAHLIERVMLEFPQRHPGLADDVRRWGNVWVDRAWKQLADLYPPVGSGSGQQMLSGDSDEGRRPLAYLWTRTVRCPNPALPEHRVDILRQTWLARKSGRAVALRPVVDRADLTVRYEVAQASNPAGLGFDPTEGSKRGQANCRVCGATVTYDYVRAEGQAGRLMVTPLCAAVLRSSGRGREYMPVGRYELPDDDECLKRLEALPVTPPEERLPYGDTRWFSTPPFGLTRYRDLFTPRQLLTLCTLAAGVRETYDDMAAAGVPTDRGAAVASCLGLTLSRLTARSSSLCYWDLKNESVLSTFARQALPMVWDFTEINPFAGSAGDVRSYVYLTAEILTELQQSSASTCVRTSAVALPLRTGSQDAVITDPPYYDNISYADLSDFFYVWLKRTVGFLYPDDFGRELTPKRSEAVVSPYRHGGSRQAAREHYESLMVGAFAEAHRVLKPGAPLVCIYAHKTTLGWAALVEALRATGFTITEAWPLDTEMTTALKADKAALASSILLVGRKRDERDGTRVGSEADVMAELDGIIIERLERLQQLGVSGSDLVIATVGAALRALTRYERVEQDNGEPLPAERFLAVVQGKVLDAIFGTLAGADSATRYYVAAQYSYAYAAVPFDEANNLARVTGVDLDSPQGLTAGPNALVQKKGSTVALRDFEDRGDDPHLGLPAEAGRPRLVDIAHGVLWRAEHRPSELRAYLLTARPDSQLLRQVVQALAGKALRSGNGDAKPREAAAAERLLVSWRRLVEENLFSS